MKSNIKQKNWEKVGKPKEKVEIKRHIRGTSKFAAFYKLWQFEVCGIL